MPLKGADVMKEQLKKMITENIDKWTDTDIYAVSLYVYDDCDNPSKPTVTLGYNTESQVRRECGYADDEGEARWNYAFWLQNEFFCFGTGETAGVVRKWVTDSGFTVCDDDNEAWKMDGLEEITEAFVRVLTDIVKEIHEEKILTARFGKELPVLIHELEYYDEIVRQNIEANGEELVMDFADWCMNF